MSGLGRFLESWRDAPAGRAFSLWVLGERRSSFEAAAPLIETVQRRQERLRIILTGPDDLRGWLRDRFPGCAVHAPPPPFGIAARRFVRRANLRGVAALDDVRLPRPMLKALADGGLPLVAIRTGPDAPPGDEAVEAQAFQRHALGAAGAEEIAGRLGEALARDHKLIRRSARSGVSPAALALAAIERPAGRRLLSRRLSRMAGREELFRALNEPRTILCLGNGPSSEDPALAGMAYDALFRVNRSWVERGVLARPDVVFTASRTAMATLEGAAFGVRSRASELRLVGARLFNPRCGPTRFFRAADVAPRLEAYDWGAFRPTNGATMLACATALRPARLIVAGVDMFSHPDGAYPGDASTPNAFAPAHDPAAELAFILHLFESYEGELVLLGEVLKKAWAVHKAARLLDGGVRG